MTKVRFAPSPTGRLHLGNVRAALVNWLFARKSGGTFLLRLDDTDRERSTAEFAAAVEADLRWLGLDWDEFARQSDRFGRYALAEERMKRDGRLYACLETSEELDLKRKLAQSRGRPYVYDRAALALSPDEISRRIDAGERPHWRFKLEHKKIVWTDLIRGPVEFHGANISDPVLVRADGVPLYTLASVVDDVDLGVTHIVRGEDHVANTAVQIELFEALGGKVPGFAHFPLIAAAGGAKLSKREGSLGIGDLREAGFERMAINSLLAKLGTSDPVEPRLALETLVAEFDFSKFSRNQPHLDPTELRALNAKLLHHMPFEAVKDRLPPGADATFWEAVRGNIEMVRDRSADESADDWQLKRVGDAWYWWQVCRGPLSSGVEPGEVEFCRAAADLLPSEPFDETTWQAWTNKVKEATGRKGRALFHPLRVALTRREIGPELRNLLPLIGRERARGRLTGEVA